MATEQETGKEGGTAATPDSPEKKMGRKKLLSASNASAYVLLTVGAVVLINLIGTRVFGRLDLTESHVYTLAPGSRAIVANLPDYLTVKAYISKELPPELQSVSRYTRDLLDEYRTYSKGKLRFEVFDPTGDKKIEDEAGQCKVQKLQVQVMRSQKFEVGAYYLGLCFQYQGKDEAIPQATQVEGLEYRVSSLLKRMTQKKQKIAVTNGHGETELQYLKHIEEFEVTSVNPSSAPIPDDVDALLVAGPKQPFDDKGRREIDAFLMKGKGAIFLVDGMAMQAPRGGMPPEMQAAQPKIGQPNDTGLNELLEKYGFKIGAGLRARSAARARADRAARRPQDARERPGVRRGQGRRGQGAVGHRAHRRAGVSVRQLGRAGRPARRRQAAGGQAVDDRQDDADRVEAHRDVLLLADGEDRGGEGERLVRPRLRVRGPAQDRLPLPRRAGRDVGA